MQFNDLLLKKGIDPAEVLVMRHQPTEPELRNVLPWLAAEKPKVYNTFQQAQNVIAEKALGKAKFLASFIAHSPGKALFVGLYKNQGSRVLNYEQYWKIKENRELRDLGMRGFDGSRPSTLWFDLVEVDFHTEWKGRLIISWPGGERSWWRWSARNEFLIDTILPERDTEQQMPKWDELVLTWAELKSLPSKWKDVLSQWRGIYYIFDLSDGRGYVGSAYGSENILGRWLDYAKSGHGGNKLLRSRDPNKFRFSILQRVSPDMDVEDMTRVEGAWKKRLLTRTHGLNQN